MVGCWLYGIATICVGCEGLGGKAGGRCLCLSSKNLNKSFDGVVKGLRMGKDSLVFSQLYIQFSMLISRRCTVIIYPETSRLS